MNGTVTKSQENNSDLYQSVSCASICEGLEIVNNVKSLLKLSSFVPLTFNE